MQSIWKAIVLLVMNVLILGMPALSFAAPRPPAGTPVTVSGKVSAFKTSPSGSVDGFVLSTGVEVRFPKHSSSQVTAIVSVGANVQVSGKQRTRPRGDTHIKAATITNLNTGASVNVP